MSRFGAEARWLTSGPPSGQRFVRGLLTELARHPQRPGRSFVAFTAGAVSGLPDGLAVRRLPAAPAPLFDLVIQLALPADVVAVLYQSVTPPVSRAGRAVVIHDLIYLSHPSLFTPIERAYFSIFPRLLSRAEVVVTVSGHVREQILDRFPARDPGSVHVVPNGVDERFFLSGEARAAAAARARGRLRLERPFILAVGRVNPRKNLARLIEAWRRSSAAELDLVIAGPSDGPRDAALEDAIRAPGRAPVLLGTVSDDDLPGLYAAAEISCYISLEEGFGVPPIEAMAAGTPVIASDIAVLREVTAGAAELCEPTSVEAIAAAIDRVLEDRDVRAALLDAGRARAAQAHWSASAAAALAALSLAAQLRGRDG